MDLVEVLFLITEAGISDEFDKNIVNSVLVL